MDKADVISSSDLIKTTTNDDFSTFADGSIKRWLVIILVIVICSDFYVV